MTRLLSQGYKVNRLSNTFKKFYGRHTDLVGQYNQFELFSFLMDLPMAKMAGVMYEADHAYSIKSTW